MLHSNAKLYRIDVNLLQHVTSHAKMTSHASDGSFLYHKISDPTTN